MNAKVVCEDNAKNEVFIGKRTASRSNRHIWIGVLDGRSKPTKKKRKKRALELLLHALSKTSIAQFKPFLVGLLLPWLHAREHPGFVMSGGG